MRELSGDELLALPVRLHGIQLGRPVDVLFDRETLRSVGFDLLCGDDVHRFLPLPTAAVGTDELAIASPLVLLEEDELDFYRSRTVPLTSLRGRAVQRKGIVVGALRDVVLRTDGELVALIIESGGRITRAPYENNFRLAPESRTAA